MQVAIKDNDGEISTGYVSNATIGELVKIDLRDENGDWISATGHVVEILED